MTECGTCGKVADGTEVPEGWTAYEAGVLPVGDRALMTYALACSAECRPADLDGPPPSE